MKQIKQSYLIDAPISKVWDALVNPDMIEEWGGGPVEMTAIENTKFSLWGGDIHGENLKVVPDKELIQDWYSGEWKTPSRVTIHLHEEHGKTELKLVHEDVPEDEIKEIAEGWETYYLGPMKKLLEAEQV